MFNPATEQIMKKRIFYIISFLVIFCMEVLIALYVRDRFIRPYVGDMLVVVLVYSFVRIFLPTGIPRMPFYVFLFACFVEVLQYFQLVETLGITNRVARIVLGSTFDWGDIACYAVGCVSLSYSSISSGVDRRGFISLPLWFRMGPGCGRNICKTLHYLRVRSDGSWDILCLSCVYTLSSWRQIRYLWVRQ